jgi:hypothetical protein
MKMKMPCNFNLYSRIKLVILFTCIFSSLYLEASNDIEQCNSSTNCTNLSIDVCGDNVCNSSVMNGSNYMKLILTNFITKNSKERAICCINVELDPVTNIKKFKFKKNFKPREELTSESIYFYHFNTKDFSTVLTELTSYTGCMQGQESSCKKIEYPMDYTEENIAIKKSEILKYQMKKNYKRQSFQELSEKSNNEKEEEIKKAKAKIEIYDSFFNEESSKFVDLMKKMKILESTETIDDFQKLVQEMSHHYYGGYLIDKLMESIDFFMLYELSVYANGADFDGVNDLLNEYKDNEVDHKKEEIINNVIRLIKLKNIAPLISENEIDSFISIESNTQEQNIDSFINHLMTKFEQNPKNGQDVVNYIKEYKIKDSIRTASVNIYNLINERKHLENKISNTSDLSNISVESMKNDYVESSSLTYESTEIQNLFTEVNVNLTSETSGLVEPASSLVEQNLIKQINELEKESEIENAENFISEYIKAKLYDIGINSSDTVITAMFKSDNSDTIENSSIEIIDYSFISESLNASHLKTSDFANSPISNDFVIYYNANHVTGDPLNYNTIMNDFSNRQNDQQNLIVKNFLNNLNTQINAMSDGTDTDAKKINLLNHKMLVTKEAQSKFESIGIDISFTKLFNFIEGGNNRFQEISKHFIAKRVLTANSTDTISFRFNDFLNDDYFNPKPFVDSLQKYTDLNSIEKDEQIRYFEFYLKNKIASNLKDESYTQLAKNLIVSLNSSSLSTAFSGHESSGVCNQDCSKFVDLLSGANEDASFFIDEIGKNLLNKNSTYFNGGVFEITFNDYKSVNNITGAFTRVQFTNFYRTVVLIANNNSSSDEESKKIKIAQYELKKDLATSFKNVFFEIGLDQLRLGLFENIVKENKYVPYAFINKQLFSSFIDTDEFLNSGYDTYFSEFVGSGLYKNSGVQSMNSTYKTDQKKLVKDQIGILTMSERQSFQDGFFNYIKNNSANYGENADSNILNFQKSLVDYSMNKYNSDLLFNQDYKVSNYNLYNIFLIKNNNIQNSFNNYYKDIFNSKGFCSENYSYLYTFFGDFLSQISSSYGVANIEAYKNISSDDIKKDQIFREYLEYLSNQTLSSEDLNKLKIDYLQGFLNSDTFRGIPQASSTDSQFTVSINFGQDSTCTSYYDQPGFGTAFYFNNNILNDQYIDNVVKSTHGHDSFSILNSNDLGWFKSDMFNYNTLQEISSLFINSPEKNYISTFNRSGNNYKNKFEYYSFLHNVLVNKIDATDTAFVNGYVNYKNSNSSITNEIHLFNKFIKENYSNNSLMDSFASITNSFYSEALTGDYALDATDILSLLGYRDDSSGVDKIVASYINKIVNESSFLNTNFGWSFKFTLDDCSITNKYSCLKDTFIASQSQSDKAFAEVEKYKFLEIHSKAMDLLLTNSNDNTTELLQTDISPMFFRMMNIYDSDNKPQGTSYLTETNRLEMTYLRSSDFILLNQLGKYIDSGEMDTRFKEQLDTVLNDNFNYKTLAYPLKNCNPDNESKCIVSQNGGTCLVDSNNCPSHKFSCNPSNNVDCIARNGGGYCHALDTSCVPDINSCDTSTNNFCVNEFTGGKCHVKNANCTPHQVSCIKSDSNSYCKNRKGGGTCHSLDSNCVQPDIICNIGSDSVMGDTNCIINHDYGTCILGTMDCTPHLTSCLKGNPDCVNRESGGTCLYNDTNCTAANNSCDATTNTMCVNRSGGGTCHVKDPQCNPDSMASCSKTDNPVYCVDQQGGGLCHSSHDSCVLAVEPENLCNITSNINCVNNNIGGTCIFGSDNCLPAENSCSLEYNENCIYRSGTESGTCLIQDSNCVPKTPESCSKQLNPSKCVDREPSGTCHKDRNDCTELVQNSLVTGCDPDTNSNCVYSNYDNSESCIWDNRNLCIPDNENSCSLNFSSCEEIDVNCNVCRSDDNVCKNEVNGWEWNNVESRCVCLSGWTEINENCVQDTQNNSSPIMITVSKNFDDFDDNDDFGNEGNESTINSPLKDLSKFEKLYVLIKLKELLLEKFIENNDHSLFIGFNDFNNKYFVSKNLYYARIHEMFYDKYNYSHDPLTFGYLNDYILSDDFYSKGYDKYFYDYIEYNYTPVVLDENVLELNYINKIKDLNFDEKVNLSKDFYHYLTN